MMVRLQCVAAAHIAYFLAALCFLFIVSFMAHLAGRGPVTSASVISGLIFVPLVVGVLIGVTMLPSAIWGSVIYLIGGLFSTQAALVAAITGGCLMLYASLTGSFPRSWHYELPMAQIIVLVLLYAGSWMAAFRFMSPPRSALVG